MHVEHMLWCLRWKISAFSMPSSDVAHMMLFAVFDDCRTEKRVSFMQEPSIMWLNPFETHILIFRRFSLIRSLLLTNRWSPDSFLHDFDFRNASNRTHKKVHWIHFWSVFFPIYSSFSSTFCEGRIKTCCNLFENLYINRSKITYVYRKWCCALNYM